MSIERSFVQFLSDIHVHRSEMSALYSNEPELTAYRHIYLAKMRH